MRKVVVSEFVSLDGVMENPKWTFEFGSEEQQQYKYEELKASDALLLGRVTYEGFAEAWPKMIGQTGEYGEWMNGYPKHVVTQTLNQLEWNHSTALKGDLFEEINKLKQQPGKDILVFGSCTLIQELMKLGLIDEFRLMVFPIVLGQGRRLFEDGIEKMTLKLSDVKSFGSGVAVLTYQKG